MGFNIKELEERMKLIIKETGFFPDESLMDQVSYWSQLKDCICSKYQNLDNFYTQEIGLDFLKENQVDFPNQDQEETVNQMLENPYLLIRDKAGAGKTAPAIKAKLALEQLVENGKVNCLVICPNFVLSAGNQKSRNTQVINRMF